MSASTSRPFAAWIALALLGTSLFAVAIAPALMPESYSWVERSISESAAQGIEGAWLARLGLLLFGFAVLLLVAIAAEAWGVGGRLAHGLYGVSIIAAAAFAHMPWEDVPYDAFEDLLHSVASFAVGLGFAVGVVIVTLRRGPGAGLIRVFDIVAIAAAVIIPMIMFNVTDVAGAVQRTLFLIAYLWYGAEAIRLATTVSSETGQMARV